jgi:hypothetical protein
LAGLLSAGFAAVAKVKGDCFGKVDGGAVFISSIISPTNEAVF